MVAALALLTASLMSSPSEAPTQAQTWVCKKVIVYGINAQGPMEDGKWMPQFSVSEGGVTFTDPNGKGSGSATWSTLPLVVTEGQELNVSLSATKMSASMWAVDCADGKSSLTRGVMDPYTPPANNLSFSFKFIPRPGRKAVSIMFRAQPTQGGPFSSCGGGVTYRFEPGTAADVAAPAKPLTAVDARTWSDKGGFRLPLKAEGAPSTMATYLTEGTPLKAVAADGVSLVLLRTASDSPGVATFTVSGAGGALYPISGESPFRAYGEASIKVETRRVADKQYAAFALYRPPSYFGGGVGDRDLKFGVSVTPQGSSKAGPVSNYAMKLVRPPVVLVHGTYDNPSYCYEEHDAESESPMNLAPRLRQSGFDHVFCVDWEATNGSKDPSDFETNRFAIWGNKNGIRDALAAMRAKGIAVTQADVVCHSQGGVISRMYARGYPLAMGLPADHPHLTNPENCRTNTTLCWFHRAENYYMGDIHRLVTISTTHRGSHVCNLFPALDKYPATGVGSGFKKLALSVFLTVVDSGFSAITTQGFYNQKPLSIELQAMGPTPVPAHAIACTATDEDMKQTRKGAHGMGDYYFKLFLVLSLTPDDAKFYAFDRIAEYAEEELARGHLKDPADQARLRNVRADVAEFKRLSKTLDMAAAQYQNYNYNARNPETVTIDKLVYLIRKIVFMGDENDCTVARNSSFGGLEAPYRTEAKNVLHGWAPRYLVVQQRVLDLLRDDGSLLDPDGFPGAYSGIKSRASTFATILKPTVNAVSPPIERPKVVPTDRRPPAGGAEAGPTTGMFSSWTPLPDGGAKVSVEGSAVTMEVPTKSTGTALAFSKDPLRGDIDMTVDYEFLDWNVAETSLTLNILFQPSADPGAKDAVRIALSGPNPDESMVFVRAGAGPTRAKRGVAGVKGRFRVVRTGATWTVSQWTGTAWQLVGTVSSPDMRDAFVGFQLERQGDSVPAKVRLRPSLGGPSRA